AYEIVRWFLADPTSKPVDPCLDDWTAPIFVVPASALDVHMVPLHDSRLGIDALVREGWTRTENGDYSAFGSNQSIIMYHRLRRDGREGYLQYLKNTHKLDHVPAESDTLQINGKTWELYEFQLKDKYLQAAVTEANNKAYVIALFTPTEEDARI